MRLTAYTDYTLRTLIYLALDPGRHATIAQIADTYRISEAHLTKVVHQLGVAGEIETVRGRNGGLRLKKSPEEINLGAVVRRTEPDLALVPCFDAPGACVIGGACVLQHTLHAALAAFLAVLDRTTLADLVAPRRRLTAMLGIAPPPRARRAAVALAS
jgi:Rrf2 family transcriptional regulator, nitric oxide-sensitive transcriptional repressor